MKMSEVGIDLRQAVDRLNRNVRCGFELITPEIAKNYLECNVNNYRTISRYTVAGYRNDILNGSWDINGEPIVFDEHGNLSNGQHRLTAVVQAGKPIITMVIHNLPETNLYDFGKKRGESDYYKACGYDTNNQFVATVNFFVQRLYRYNGSGAQARKSTGENERIIKENYSLLATATSLTYMGGATGVCRKASVSACIFSLLRMGLANEDEINQVMRIANTGYPISGHESSPGLALRQVLDDLGGRSNTAQKRMAIFDATYQAVIDYKNGVQRKKKYTMTSKSAQLLEKTSILLGIKEDKP